MFRRANVLIVLTLYNCITFSQQLPPPPAIPNIPPPQPNIQNQYFPSKIIDPATGKIFQNKDVDVTGSPFFEDDWKFSAIKLADGRTFEMVKARIDLYRNELYFKGNNDVEMVLDSGSVKEINIYLSATDKTILYKFQTGFTPIDNQDQNTFYQVMSSGNIMLLKLIKKELIVNKKDLSGEVDKQFEVHEYYYVYNNNRMKRLKKDKDLILKILSEKKDQIEKFINDQSTDFKNINDIILLFNFYSSLFLH